MAFRIENRIGVATPPAAIWDLLADLEGWSRWNPLYRDATGRFGYGETLSMILTLPDEAPQTIAPAITDWTPNSLVHWNLKALGGLVRTTRYLEIEVLTETGCIFSNGEIFEGLGARVLSTQLRRNIRRGFDAFGAAVKREAEARWAASGDVAA